MDSCGPFAENLEGDKSFVPGCFVPLVPVSWLLWWVPENLWKENLICPKCLAMTVGSPLCGRVCRFHNCTDGFPEVLGAWNTSESVREPRHTDAIKDVLGLLAKRHLRSKKSFVGFRSSSDVQVFEHFQFKFTKRTT